MASSSSRSRRLLVPAALVLAGCGQRSPSAPPPSGQASARDAAPAVVAPAPADGTAPAPAGDAAPPVDAACLPSESGATLGFDGREAALCWSQGGGDDPDTCLWASPAGAVRRGPAPAAVPAAGFPQVTILDDDRQPLTEPGTNGSAVEVCLARDRCRTIVPARAVEAISEAVVDPVTGQVAISIHADPLDGGRVEVHDAASGKRLAGGTRAWDDHHGVSYAIAWVGRWLLWVEFPGASAGANGELWRRSGSRLIAGPSIADRVYDHAVGKTLAVFVGSELSAEVHDLASGKRVRTIDLQGLFAPAGDEMWESNADLGPSVAVVGDDAVFSLTFDGETRLGFVALARGAPTTVVVPRCPP